MKKLLILATAVAMACASRAASFTWGFGSIDIQDSTSQYMDGGTAFLYLGSIATTETTYDLAGTTLLAYGGQNDDYTYGSLSATVSSDSLSSVTAGQAYTLVLVETSGLTTLDGFSGNMIVATGSSTLGVNPMDDTDTWAIFQSPTAYTASSWQNLAPVPEPTSGLLMLLGMAGLALRRKRA